MFECIIGKLSYKYNKYHTWNYSEYFLCACDGYISFNTFLIWIFASGLFYKIVDLITINS